jgi:hypothetical protein
MAGKYVRPIGAEGVITAADTVGNARLVRLYNPTANAADVVVTLAGTVNGTFTLKSGDIEIIEKHYSDTVAVSGAGALAVQIAYRV